MFKLRLWHAKGGSPWDAQLVVIVWLGGCMGGSFENLGRTLGYT
jgi:hypothetical protein